MAEEFNVLGKRGLRRIDGYERASGEGLYTRDVRLPGMLYAKPFTSPYAHARIKSIDTSKAEALPGVRYIIKYDDPDIVGQDYLAQWWGYAVLMPDTADFWGQPIGAAVCADSLELCDEALKLLEIDWEVLPFILDPEEALEPNAPVLHPEWGLDSNLMGESVEEHGDVEKGFAEADVIIEFGSSQEEDVWAGVEPLSCVAVWRGDNLDVWFHNQCPQELQTYLSKFHPANKIQVYSLYQGAEFGGLTWFGYPFLHARLTDILAERTGKPVYCTLDSSHFYGSGWAMGVYNWRVGAKNDGTVTAAVVETIQANADISKLTSSTKIENLYAKQISPYVSKGPTTCYRHGAVGSMHQLMVLDHVAAELGMDPTEVALKNDGCHGHDMAWVAENVKSPQGFDQTRDSLRECIEAGKAAFDWDNKWHAPGTKELPNGKMHGVGFTWTYEWAYEPRGGLAGVMIRQDGTASILARRSDFGVSAETAVCVVVAEELGMRYEDVHMRGQHDYGGDLQDAGGSSGSITNTAAVVPAARKAKQILLELAVKPIPAPFMAAPREAPFPGLKPEDLDVKDSMVFEKANPSNTKTVAEVIATHWGMSMSRLDSQAVVAFHSASEIYDDREKYAMCRHAHFMEVEVDTETGEVEVTKVVNVNDVGTALYPEGVEGQQYGGTYMGVGRSRDEAVYYDPMTGMKLNDNLEGYKFTTMAGCGPIDTVIVETGLAYGPYGNAGIGENVGAITSTLTAPAIYNAIGKWVDYPNTPDKVLKALGKI